MDWSALIALGGTVGLLAVWVFSKRRKAQQAKLARFKRRFEALSLVRAADLSLDRFLMQAHRSAHSVFGGPFPDVVAYEDLKPMAANLVAIVRQSQRDVPALSAEEHLAAGLVLITFEQHDRRKPLDIELVAHVFALALIGSLSSNDVIARAYALIYDAASPAPRP